MSVLLCSICLYLPSLEIPGEVRSAYTVINGQAVCPDHVGYVAGGAHSQALMALSDHYESQQSKT